MQTKFREASKFPSITDGYSKIPIAVQGLRPDVPQFMVVHVLHFNPKWATQPFTSSPSSIVDIANLGLLLLNGFQQPMVNKVQAPE